MRNYIKTNPHSPPIWRVNGPLMNFVNYAKSEPSFPAGNIMGWVTNIKLPDYIKTKYNKPFITKSDYNAVRKFPALIPTNEQDNEAIINQRLNKKLNLFDKPFVTIWGNHNDLMWKGKYSTKKYHWSKKSNTLYFRIKPLHTRR